jgi:Ca2+-binding RTX toxin-like protein
MTTGTEGPDVLRNNSTLLNDSIQGLGGDDRISISGVGYGGSITVDGGAGFDTLTIIAPYLYAMGVGSLSVTALSDNVSHGRIFYTTNISYSSIERLVIYADAFQGDPAWGYQTHFSSFQTGDTIDEIHILSKRWFPFVTVDSGGGDDKIYLGDVPAMSSAYGGAGDDLVDLTGVRGGGVRGNGAEGNDILVGSPGWDLLLGGPGNDQLRAGAGAGAPGFGFSPDVTGDFLDGGDGEDILYFGAGFDSGDRATGGEGRDVLVLQGNYDLTLGSNLTGIESISLQSGANARFGDSGGNLYDFVIATADSNVAAGQQMIVNGQSLRAGEDFTLDGSAESDGRFLVFGGHGVDTLKGGSGNDVFVFDGTRWGAGDSVDGGGGRDSLVITAGNGLTHVDFGASSLAGIESISVANRYSSDPAAAPSYEFVLDDGNVAPGGTLIVNASSLQPGQVMKLDGTGVRDGNLILFGGAGHDTLTAGDGADLIVGGGGADSPTGGAGADTFRYDQASDSAPGLEDLIGDFQPGLDRIDLSRIDADSATGGDQAFRWIGSAAFGGSGAASAGELRSFESGGYRRIEGDTDGDGAADFVIVLQAGTPPLSVGDFLL